MSMVTFTPLATLPTVLGLLVPPDQPLADTSGEVSVRP